METSDIIAASAVVIAVLSFAVTIWQGIISRRHNHLSVKPHLYVDLNVITDGPIKLVIKNNGLGPAFIKDFRILANGKKIDEIGKVLYHKALEEVDLLDYEFQYFKIGDQQALPANAEIDLYTFEANGLDEEDRKQIEYNLEKIDLEIDYESIYSITYQYYEKNHLTNKDRL